jgi:hypothetical protein
MLDEMRTTFIFPVAALVVAGAIGAAGVTMESEADDAPLAPIIVRAPEDLSPALSRPPALPAPSDSVRRPAAPPADADGVPVPPPAVTGSDTGRLPAITKKVPPPPAVTTIVPDVPSPAGGDDDGDDWGYDDFDGED